MPLFDILRLTGDASWQDQHGKTLYGWSGNLTKVGTVEADTPEAAFDAARSVRDPSPILQPVDA